MHPMLKSERDWKLTVIYKGITSESVRPEKKTVNACIFRIGYEEVRFYGSEKMSPFDFESFSITIVACSKADTFQVGLTIK